MNRAFERESSNFEFNPEMGEFDEAEFDEAEFDEAEFDEAEFDEAEFDEAEFDEAEFDEAETSTRDHRRRATPQPPTRSRVYVQRPYSSRSAGTPRPFRYPGRPRYSPRPFAAPRPFTASRPYGGARPFQWRARPAFSSRPYATQQLPRQYYRYGQRPYYQYGQQPFFSAGTPGWGRWRRWGGWPYRQPRYATYSGPSYYDEPSYAEPPYEEPVAPPVVVPAPMMPPPMIEPVAPPPMTPPMTSSMAQPAMAEPPAPAEPSTAGPAAAATPPAQDQPAAGEYYIEPEAFEFDPEYDEYQSGWGEAEGDFGEYEGGQPQPAAACPPYQRGEVERSRTAPGHLPSDVIQHSRGLLIADFGVDRPTPKSALARDAALRNWLDTVIRVVRANPSTQIRISGYSDCVGRENNNNVLRRGRARRMLQLLQRLAGPQWAILRPKIAFVGAAPTGDYVGDNGTVEGRAQNRGVLIEHARTVDFAPDDGSVVTGRIPDTIERICRRGLELIRDRNHFGIPITQHQQQRIRCFISRLCQPGFDDRYLTGQGVLDYSNRVYSDPYYANAKQWLLPEFAVRAGGQRSDQDIWQTLIRIDDDIIQGRHKINYFFHTHGAATPVRVQRLRDWVAGQENSNRSIYWCYGRHAP